MVVPADSDGSICKKWMQNALRFVMKNRSFSSLINNFKIRIKSYLSKRKNFYFSSEIWGRFAFTFCRYFHQNLQVLPSESVAGNTLRFRGKKQYIFQTKFFPLEFEGILYNSVLCFCVFYPIKAVLSTRLRLFYIMCHMGVQMSCLGDFFLANLL